MDDLDEPITNPVDVLKNPKDRITMWALFLLLVVIVQVTSIFYPNDSWSMFPGHAGSALLIFFAAHICEYVDSSLGMGYGTALTPILLLAGFDVKEVVPVVLLSELFTGLFATFMHHADGNVNFFRDKNARSTAFSLSLLSAVGASCAVLLSVNIPKKSLSVLICCIILAAGVLILATSRRQFKYRKSHIIGLGALAAFNKGVSGGGYGPLVTAGQVVSGVPPKSAVAISSFAESFTCAIGFTGYMLMGTKINLNLAFPLIIGAMASVPVATLTIKKIKEEYVRFLVGVVTVILGVISAIKLF